MVEQVSAPTRTRGVREQKKARRKSPERNPLEKTGLHGPPRQVLSNLLSQLDWEIGRIVFGRPKRLQCHCMERNRSRPRGTSFSSDERCPRSTSHCRAVGSSSLQSSPPGEGISPLSLSREKPCPPLCRSSSRDSSQSVKARDPTFPR